MKNLLISKELEGIIDEKDFMAYPHEDSGSYDYFEVNVALAPGTTGISGSLSGMEIDDSGTLKSISLIFSKNSLTTLLLNLKNISEIILSLGETKQTYQVQTKAKRNFKIEQVTHDQPIYVIHIGFCK